MKIVNQRIFEGRNIYSHKKVMRLDVDLEGFCETPSKDIQGFNEKLIELIPELYEHRCGIDEDHGFYTRLIEGTYLAHICEHMIIALHNRIGINVSYGKAREIYGDNYYIIFEYEYPKAGLAIAHLAIELVNSIIANVAMNLSVRVDMIRSILKNEMRGPSTDSIYNEAVKAKMPLINIGNGTYQIGYGKRARIFGATIGSNTKCIAVDICCDKMLTKNILEMNSLPVAMGDKVTDTISLLKLAEKIGYPVVLKPQYGSKGAGVCVNIKNEIELLECYTNLKDKKIEDIIIEEYVEGKDYRVCVINYKVVAVSHRTAPYVIGNGEKSIKKLIDELNSNPMRGDGHEKPLTKIKLDKHLDGVLRKHRLDINYVPSDGQKVYLRENANISTGGFAEDCTDLISDENRRICERVARAIGLDICGIDISTNNIAKSLNNYGIIIEVNAAPGIRMHEFPSKGPKREVAKEILKTMYNGRVSNIPVIAVTGTNGKTTTTRLISYVISRIGYTVGMTSTDGVVIGNEFIHKGDDTGFESARSVLINKEVDVAVLETARGGIIRNGLAYDLADVGIITNIKEDHLGIDNMNDINDLMFVKSLVAEAIKDDGYIVVNGDDEYCEAILGRAAKRNNAKSIIFSMDKNNRFIKENIEKGYPCIYVEDNFITAYNRNKTYRICDLRYMPLTMEGKLKHNIYNALAACAGLVGMGVDYVMIAKGFLEFKSDEKDNSGRFNIYEIEGREIILDYGHNLDGYKAIIESLEAMGKKNIRAIIGMPGDRSDKNIRDIGKICAESFDKLYIKEDDDKRGRKTNEVASLLLEGAKKAGIDSKNISIILDEADALAKAYEESEVGDTIILFFENHNKVVNKLKLLKKQHRERA